MRALGQDRVLAFALVMGRASLPVDGEAFSATGFSGDVAGLDSQGRGDCAAGRYGLREMGIVSRPS